MEKEEIYWPTWHNGHVVINEEPIAVYSLYRTLENLEMDKDWFKENAVTRENPLFQTLREHITKIREAEKELCSGDLLIFRDGTVLAVGCRHHGPDVWAEYRYIIKKSEKVIRVD